MGASNPVSVLPLHAQNSADAPVVVLTGASGFIGRALTRAFVAAGFRVRALVRAPDRFLRSIGATGERVTCLAWQLGEPLPAAALAPAPAAFVHAAFDVRGAGDAGVARNVQGTRLLLDAVRASGPTHCVLISSFSAGPAGDAGLNRVSAYSRAKQDSERLFDPARDLIVRPGLVVGPGADGLFARMRAQIERGTPLPLFYRGETPVQWIHVDELAGLLVAAVARRVPGLYAVASPGAVSLAEWTQAVAGALGLHARTFRVPGPASDAAARVLRVAERLGARLPIRSDTVYGIKYARLIDTRASLAQLGAHVGGLGDTLQRVARA